MFVFVSMSFIIIPKSAETTNWLSGNPRMQQTSCSWSRGGRGIRVGIAWTMYRLEVPVCMCCFCVCVK